MSDNLITGIDLGLRLLNAMGVDPDGVVDMEIQCRIGEVAAVRITRLVPESVAVGIVAELITYKLVEDKPDGSTTKEA